MDNKNNNIILYTIPELVKILNINPQSIRKYLKEGRLKGVKVGTRWVVEEEALREFLRGE